MHLFCKELRNVVHCHVTSPPHPHPLAARTCCVQMWRHRRHFKAPPFRPAHIATPTVNVRDTQSGKYETFQTAPKCDALLKSELLSGGRKNMCALYLSFSLFMCKWLMALRWMRHTEVESLLMETPDSCQNKAVLKQCLTCLNLTHSPAHIHKWTLTNEALSCAF